MTTKKVLLEEENDESGGFGELKINKDYAKRYQERKERHEKSCLEEKYGPVGYSSDEDDEDSESMVEEDEDGSLLTPAIDAQILKTISAIRAHDPALYDPSKSFFDESTLKSTEKEWKRKEKKLTLLDYQHQQVATGQLPDDSDHEGKTFQDEQKELKEEFKSVLKEEEDEDFLLIKKEKTAEEKQKEEEEYRKFLLENLGKSETSSQTMQQWFKFNQVRDQLEPNERFLIDFVLNRGWIDKKKEAKEDELLELDEELEEKAEEVEFKHNFRFEQEGAEMIPTFGRNIEGSLRRPDTKRKEQRETLKKRKAEEKSREEEEVKRLKNIKKEEIKKKLSELEKVSGKKLGKKEIDFESDFDPEEHDRRMAKLFDEKYYGESESEDNMVPIDDEKEELVPPQKAFKYVNKALEKKDEDKKLGDILNEYYKLDYEDKIEDLACRFKYISNVPASSFGLEVEEILGADDKALNSHVSIKKLAPYRPLEKQQQCIKTYSDKRRVWKFRNILKEGGNKTK